MCLFVLGEVAWAGEALAALPARAPFDFALITLALARHRALAVVVKFAHAARTGHAISTGVNGDPLAVRTFADELSWLVGGTRNKLELLSSAQN